MNLRPIFFALAVCLHLLTTLAHATICQINFSPSNPDSVYSDNGDGTVTHLPTGLIWKRCSEGQNWTGSTCTGTPSSHTWTQALVLATTSRFVGQNDWRLPNIRELVSLIEDCRSMPAINDTVFPATPFLHFWSSSPGAYLWSDRAWGVNFGSGVAAYYPRTGYGGDGVRLVRGGQSFDSLGAASDTTPPALTAVGLSGIGQAAATLSATSNEVATGYWLAMPSGATAPSAAQVKSGVNYAGVTIAASGYGAMTTGVPRSFTISGLAVGTNYDFYVVAMDSSGNLSAAPVKVQGSTLAAPVGTSTAPTPSSPSGKLVVSNNSPTLSWSGGSSMSSLRINVSQSPYGSTYLVYQSAWLDVGTTSIIPTGLVAATSYRWNVTACSDANGTGTCLTGSSAYFLTPALPIPTDCDASTVATITPNGFAFADLGTSPRYQAFDVVCQSGRIGVVRLPEWLQPQSMEVCGYQQGSCPTKAAANCSAIPSTTSSINELQTALKVVFDKRSAGQAILLADPLVGPLANWVCQ